VETDRSPQRTPTATYLMLLAAVLLWGGNWVAAKLAVGAVPPITLATLRYAVAAPLLLLWLARQGPLPRVERRDLLPLLALGVLYGVASNLLFLVGLQFAPSVDGAILYPGFQPVFAALIAVVLLGELLRGRQLFGFAVALAGLVLVVGGGQASASGGQARLLGDLMFLAGAIIWAYTNVLARLISRRLSPMAVTTYSALICLPLLLLLSLLLEDGWARLPSALPWAWPSLGYMALVSTGPPTLFFYTGIRRLGVARASAFSYLIPVSGVAFTVLLLGEAVLPLQIAGGLLVLVGLWLVSRPATASSVQQLRILRQESRP